MYPQGLQVRPALTRLESNKLLEFNLTDDRVGSGVSIVIRLPTSVVVTLSSVLPADPDTGC